MKVCEVQLDGNAAAVVGEVAPGASIELPANPNAHRIWLTSCTKDSVVAGNLFSAEDHFAGVVHPVIALYDAGATPAANEHAVFAAPETFESAHSALGHNLIKGWAPGKMAEHTKASLEALRGFAEGRGYPEKYSTLQLLTPDWEINRDRRDNSIRYRHISGLSFAQFPSGKCIMYPVGFMQMPEGAGFSSTMTSNGAGGGVGVPCAMATWAATLPHSAQ